MSSSDIGVLTVGGKNNVPFPMCDACASWKASDALPLACAICLRMLASSENVCGVSVAELQTERD